MSPLNEFCLEPSEMTLRITRPENTIYICMCGRAIDDGAFERCWVCEQIAGGLSLLAAELDNITPKRLGLTSLSNQELVRVMVDVLCAARSRTNFDLPRSVLSALSKNNCK